MTTGRWVLAATLALLAATASAQERTRLQVGSMFGPRELVELKKLFEAENADIEIIWDREQTASFIDRLLGGQGARPDALWGLPVLAMLPLQRRNLLEPYAPPSLADIKPAFRDPADPPAWIGMNAWIAAVCFNPAVAAKLGVPKPTSWLDLVEPRFKDRISMPHPASSVTGYLLIAGWLKLFGEERGWKFIDRLDKNVVSYESTGLTTCRHAATGIVPVGLSFDYAVTQTRQSGGDFEALVMTEGGGWDMDSSAILKGTPRLAAARRLMDFAAGRKANQQYATLLGQVALSGIEGRTPHYPPGVARSLNEADFAWAVDNRERIVAEWMRRFGAKAPVRN